MSKRRAHCTTFPSTAGLPRETIVTFFPDVARVLFLCRPRSECTVPDSSTSCGWIKEYSEGMQDV